MGDGQDRDPTRESGTRIESMLRPGFGGKPAVELRVHLDEYEGRKYVSIRQWELAPGKGYVATKRGTSVRLGELHRLVEALQKVIELEGVERTEHRHRQPRERATAATTTRAATRPPASRPAPLLPEAAQAVEPPDELDEYRKHPRGGASRG